jgi:hypothetical protein
MGVLAMTNPTAVYDLKGCKIKERQLFVRSYYIGCELTTGTYFIDGGRAYFISADDGEVGRCNFNAGFLNTGHTKSIEPLDQFYDGEIRKTATLL